MNSHARLLHTMLRVRDLDASLDFYVGKMGMRLLRRQDFPNGQFTLAFVGYGNETETAVIELTYNWDDRGYVLGTAFGHIAIGVEDIFASTRDLARQGVKIVRPAGPLDRDESEMIAFVEDPDGYWIELIERKTGR